MSNNDFDDSLDDEGNIAPSKSALKREMTELQKFGQQLIGLPDSRRAQIPLSEEMRDAIALYQRLTQREARRRQLQFIGKQMRREDTDAIMAALTHLEQQDQQFRQRFHQLEALRDRLISEGDKALTELIDEAPELDRQLLRQLVRQARQEAERGKPPAASRKLFRYLREALGA